MSTGTTWWRVELNKDGGISTVTEVEQASKGTRLVCFVQATTRADACSRAKEWWVKRRAVECLEWEDDAVREYWADLHRGWADMLAKYEPLVRAAEATHRGSTDREIDDSASEMYDAIAVLFESEESE